MRPIGRRLRPARYAALAVLTAAMLGASWGCHGDANARPHPRGLRAWDLPRMVAHLRDAGLDLRRVDTAKDRALGRSAFLTATDKGWEELHSLLKVRSQLAEWRGSLYVERGRDDETWDVHVAGWGSACVVAGPFIFFGDPELLARVRAALGPAGTEDRS